MDCLALLCNLYGDGPATLRRLREAGCGSLESLEQLDIERLAGLLRTSVRCALRFQAEGRLLRERSEPAPARAATATATAAEPADPLLRKVLAAWRQKDAEEEGLAAAPASAGSTSAAPEPDLTDAGSLRAGVLDGLDAASCARLAARGVRTVAELSAADALELARDAGLAYTRLLRLQLLARRRADPAEAQVELAASPRPSRTDERSVLLPRSSPASGQPSAAPPSADAGERFSPAEAPVLPGGPPLETELERLAAEAARPPAAREGTLESSGPFA